MPARETRSPHPIYSYDRVHLGVDVSVLLLLLVIIIIMIIVIIMQSARQVSRAAAAAAREILARRGPSTK